MTSKFSFEGRNEIEVVLKFGGGQNTNASEDDIRDRESAGGQNAQLDLGDRNLRNRPAFDQVGTVPNGSEIRGFVTQKQTDGTVKFLVQGGTNVYDWDGVSTFTSVATVNSNARLRGRKEHNWLLDDKVIVTDLALAQPVMEYDGTTLQNASFNLAGDFLAKYCFVAAERAWFGHVDSNNVRTPHILVGSQRQDFTQLSVTDRPASSLNDEDPFFLVTPDLKPINGLVQSWTSTSVSGGAQDQRLVISSEEGVLSKIVGQSAQNFTIAEFYPESGAAGAESVRFIGNDIVYGRPGRIESVIATETFGDVAADDLSLPIKDMVQALTDWTTVYNSRNTRVYFFPDNESSVYVYFKDLRGTDVSPWYKWTTQHPLSFQPTAVMNMFDPADGLEYVFMGDSSGNIYRLEGRGVNGDGGTTQIQLEFLSRLYVLPRDAEAFNITGYVKYRKNLANTITLRFEHAGYHVFNEEITVELTSADTPGAHWSSDAYWGGDFFWNVRFAGKLTRQKFTVAGQSSDFQVRVIVEGTNPIEINEIGLQLEAAS